MWNSMPCKNGFDVVDYVLGCSCRKFGELHILRKIVNDEEILSTFPHKNRSVATFCQGKSGRFDTSKDYSF